MLNEKESNELMFWANALNISIPQRNLAVINAVERFGGGVKGVLTFVCFRLVVKRYGSVASASFANTMAGALGGIIYDVLYERSTLSSINVWFRNYLSGKDIDPGTKVRCELQSHWFVMQTLDLIKLHHDGHQGSPGAQWATKVVDFLEKT